MKISYNWLKAHLDTQLTPSEISSVLTATGLEVESIEKSEPITGGLEGVVVGEVLEISKHPDADRLKITQVNIGNENLLQIVCGASNVEVGQKVLVATVGSTIHPTQGDPIKIKKSKIRGIESHGMICAEDELGLGVSHDGIMVLDPSTLAGSQAIQLFDMQTDYIFEIGLTPNRSDAMSHIGVARDLKAFQNFHHDANLSLNIPTASQFESGKNKTQLSVTIENEESCKRYAGAVVRGIQISESPAWLKARLVSIGLKPINNVVDITNYVMHEMGNPLHAFDLSAVGSEILIRSAKAGETLVTLDGVERKLNEEDLVICNAAGPMCLAGVMGGLHSGISDQTAALFLEAACFSGSAVRKTSKRHILNSDSSFRFERGVDPSQVIASRDRALSLITEICGGEVEQVYDLYPNPTSPKEILLVNAKCRSLIGKEISNEEIKRILLELEFQILEDKGDSLLIQVPLYRNDVQRPADLYEEVLRIYGFNNIEVPEKLNSSITYSVKPNQELYVNTVSDLLANNGFFEIMNNSLTSSNRIQKTDAAKTEQNITLLNPLSNELDVLRTSLLDGVMQTIVYNQNRQNPDLKLFEFGKVYEKNDLSFVEQKKLALILTGNFIEENWTSPSRKSDFYTLKSIIWKITQRLGAMNLNETMISHTPYEYGVSIKIKNQEVGTLGLIQSQIQKFYGIKNKVWYGEINWDKLIACCSTNKTEFSPLPKTQFVRRDFSLLVNEGVKFEAIREIAMKSAKKHLIKVGLFDVYEGKNLPEGKKSYAVSFMFQDPEKTMKDEQLDDLMSGIQDNLTNQLGAELR